MAIQTLDTDISAQPYYLPVIAAAGVLLPQADHVSELDVQYHHLYSTGKSGVIALKRYAGSY